MKRILTPFTGLANRELPIPRQHLYAIIMLACFSVASITLLPPPGELLSDEPIPVSSDNLTIDAELSKQAADTEFVTVPHDALLDDDDGIPDDITAPTGELQLMDYIVKDDDNLSYIFNTLNLSPVTLQKLVEVDIQNSLVRLKPGQKSRSIWMMQTLSRNWIFLWNLESTLFLNVKMINISPALSRMILQMKIINRKVSVPLTHQLKTAKQIRLL